MIMHNACMLRLVCKLRRGDLGYGEIFIIRRENL